MNKMTLRTVPALLALAFTGSASAAAFQLWEQNASGMGTAYAGSAAVADNASTIFYNPAGMSQLNGIQVSVGVAAIGPSYEFHNEGSTGATGNGGNGGDAGGWHGVPNAYFSWQVAPNWNLGLGISSPFGLATEYDNTNWIGARQAVKSELRTVNYNPSVSYRLSDKVSLGAGINYQTLNAELTNSLAKLKGDDSAIGWNAGALFTLSPAMRVGVSYRSAMKYHLEGKLNDTTPINADVKLPDTFILSVWQQVSDRWEAMGDLSYTRWNTLKALNVYSQATGALITSETFNYDNSWRLAWGAAYKATDSVKLKFGIAYDRTPVSNDDRSARVPDNDRVWFSLGGQWNAGAYGRFDLGYSYLYVKDASVNQSKNGTNLRGHYENGAHLLGAQYSVGF